MEIAEVVKVIVDNGVTVGMIVAMCVYIKHITDSHEKEVSGLKEMIYKVNETLVALTIKIDNLK